MKFVQIIKNNISLVYAMLCVVFAVGVIVFIFPQCTIDYINYDSSYQFFLTQHSMAEIWELLPQDYSPPLYAVLLKIYTMIFGNSLFVMRTFSLFAVGGMLWLAFFPVRAAFGCKTSFVCGVMVFSNAIVYRMLPEIRPTIFGMFFMMAIAVYAYIAFFQDKKYAYICLTVFSVLGMYTHNITMLGALGVYVVSLLFCLIKRNVSKFKKFFISGLVCAVIYIPWLIVVFKQFGNVQENFWSTNISTDTVFRWLFFDFFSIGVLTPFGSVLVIVSLLLIAAAVIVILLAVRNRKLSETKTEITDSEEKKQSMLSLPFLICELIFPIALMVGFHYLCYPLASRRYMFIYSILLAVIISVAVTKYLHKLVSVAYCVLAIINCCYNNAAVRDDISKSDAYVVFEKIKNENPDGKIAFLHTHEFFLGIMSYYFPDAEHYVCDETFTVLNTYDVFTTNITNVGSIENIWNYTDEFYMWSDYNYEEYCTFDKAKVLLSPDNIECNPDKYYKQAYTTCDWILPYKLSRE